jgi:hypothetical protein
LTSRKSSEDEDGRVHPRDPHPGQRSKQGCEHIHFIKGVEVVDDNISTFLRDVQNLLPIIQAIIRKMNEMPGAVKTDSEVAQLWGPTEATLRNSSRSSIALHIPSHS